MKRSIIQPERVKRVVVRGVNWVGDAVMTVPALRELRRVLPNAEITLATRSWTLGLFEDADFLDDVLIYDRGPRDLGAAARQTREWRRRRFDLAILFQNAFEAALIAATARVPVRVGYATDRRGPLLTHALSLPSWRDQRHEVFYYLNIVSELERLLNHGKVAETLGLRLNLDVSDKRKASARHFLRSQGVAEEGFLVALCPGSTNSRAKRWPAERYAALADRFVSENGADVILLGSREELGVSREVEARMRHRPIVLTGRTDLAQSVAILSLTDVLITNDTGPAHIAAALNRPTLVIFGPTDPRTTRPFSHVAEIVRHPPECAPCMLRDCPIDHRCMTAITPDEVFLRASAILKRRGEGVSG